MQNNVEKFSPEMFEFANRDGSIHDQKFETKAVGYWKDAFRRFRKNTSSVVAACIIGILILFAIVSPIISPYTLEKEDLDSVYKSYPPFVESIAEKGWGILDGSIVYSSQNANQLLVLQAKGQETGNDPLLEILEEYEIEVMYRGRPVKRTMYKVKVNKYYEVGMVYRNLSYEEYAKIQRWQDENQIQVIYPYVNPKDIYDIKDNPNIWYELKKEGKSYVPKLDEDGNFVPVYSTESRLDKLGAPYTSTMRIEGDDGSYAYSTAKSGSVQCRVDYYAYYQYVNGLKPTYVFGTNAIGMDLFCAIGVGARFSLIFAVIVSAINLTIGAFYGSIQGYYGGVIDMVLDRISDILSGVPFIVVATLFQLHLAQKVGTLVSFLFAFVLTGWIGMAALTRKQFYRFKGQEYVLAARTLGASDGRLMFKHIFPNSLGTMVTSCVLVIPGVIGSETSLTYLGIINLSEMFGTSIGTLMAQGQTAMKSAPHAMFYPALFVSLLLICFNLFGNGLRDAFNPSTRGEDA